MTFLMMPSSKMLRSIIINMLRRACCRIGPNVPSQACARQVVRRFRACACLGLLQGAFGGACSFFAHEQEGLETISSRGKNDS